MHRMPGRSFARSFISGPRFTSIVGGLSSVVPFVAPEEMERSRARPFAVRLGANELTVGPSPRSVAAMARAAGDCWMYGDPKSHDLRTALAAYHGVQLSNICVGEGIDGLLACVAQLLVDRGDAVVTTRGTYPTLSYFVQGMGGTLHNVPYGKDDRHDIHALLRTAAEVDAKLIYFVNPDNPSGTWHEPARVEAMIEQAPPGCLVLIDEAYHELGHELGTVPQVAADDLRVLRLRTFSKGYGMAGARIGYAIGAQEIIAAFDKIRSHFGVNRIAQAGALAALEDAAYLDRVREQVAAGRARLSNIAREHGLSPLPSATNFVTIDCGRDGPFARLVLAEMLERDVFVRMPGAAPLDRCIRVSAGTDEELSVFEAALPQALEAASRLAELE